MICNAPYLTTAATTPTSFPSTSPSVSPTIKPTTLMPSGIPSVAPSGFPSSVPSPKPTSLPSSAPTTLSPSSQPSMSSAKPTSAPIAATTTPVKRTSPPFRKLTAAPVSNRPTSRYTTYSPTVSTHPTQLITTLSPTFAATVDHTGVLVRPLADFVIAYSVGSSSSTTANGSIRRRRGRQQRHLLSVSRYQLTALTAKYLIEQLQTDFPNSHVKTVALVLTSVSAQVSVDHNSTTNTSTSTSTFQEALSGEAVFGTTQTSLLPVLNDLYNSIQTAFTDAKSLKTYFRLLHGSKDPVLKRISQVTLIQGVSSVNTTTTSPSPNTTSSSSNATTQTNQAGVKWSVTLIAIVAGAGMATLCVALLVYLCITHKSRKRRRRLRQQQREQKRKEAQKAKEAKAAERANGIGTRIPPPPPVETSSNSKTVVPAKKSRRWLSWGGHDQSMSDLALQPTASVNSSPLSLITTPRSKSDSPIKASAANSKRRTIHDFEEIVSENDDDERYRNAEEEDQSEVTSTYSYIETNTNDEHSISVAPSFLYGPNETGSVMGDFDDFGELVGATTNRIHRTPWIDDLNLAPKPSTWVSANTKKVPAPPTRNASAPPILNVGMTENTASATTQSSQDADNSHLLNITASYGSFYEYDEKKGIMLISRPSVMDEPMGIDGEMPSKIGGSFAMEDSFFTQEGSQTNAFIAAAEKGEFSVLDSPGRMPGMESGGSLFLNSPSTSFSANSPRKGASSARKPTQSASVDDQGIGDVLQFYEGTTSATSTSTTLSPVNAKKFAFGDVWRDIVEEDVEDHVRDTTSSTNSQGCSPANMRNVMTNALDAHRNDASLRSTSSSSRRANEVSRELASEKALSNKSALEDSVSFLKSPDRLNQSGASSRKSMTPKRTATTNNADDDIAESFESQKQSTRVSFSSESQDFLLQGTSPAAKQADARSQEMTTRRWLASQANERSEVKQTRSKSVAPSAGHRQKGAASNSNVSNTKRSSSLPPSRHAALHQVREEQPFDEELKNWSPRVQKVDESSDDVGAKLSI